MFSRFLRGNKAHNKVVVLVVVVVVVVIIIIIIIIMFLFPVLSLHVAFLKRFCTTNCGVGKP